MNRVCLTSNQWQTVQSSNSIAAKVINVSFKEPEVPKMAYKVLDYQADS